VAPASKYCLNKNKKRKQALVGCRAIQFGVPLKILVDCDGVCHVPRHFFYILSYSILNHEDEIGQLHALRVTKEQIEVVAKKYNCVSI